MHFCFDTNSQGSPDFSIQKFIPRSPTGLTACSIPCIPTSAESALSRARCIFAIPARVHWGPISFLTIHSLKARANRTPTQPSNHSNQAASEKLYTPGQSPTPTARPTEPAHPRSFWHARSNPQEAAPVLLSIGCTSAKKSGAKVFVRPPCWFRPL